MDLFTPYRMGDLSLNNRMVMAPMTRCRAGKGDVPGPLARLYYVQRAAAGLIITEGSQVSPMGIGFSRTPGIYSDDQVSGWQKVTDAIHRTGGKIVLQLWHVGRVSHPDFLSDNLPVAPSALPVGELIHVPSGKKEIPVPRELALHEIPQLVEQFRDGARNARRAGFDGVEIHGANGYLLDQFLRDGSNRRTDGYGGSLLRRMSFPLEVAGAVVREWGPARVGYRISPHFFRHAMSDSDPETTFLLFAEQLSDAGVGYLHLIEPVGGRMGNVSPKKRMASRIRQRFAGTLMLNGGYDAASGNAAIGRGEADLISFGELFLANPDLPGRFRQGMPLNKADPDTFYTGEEKGYTDYPVAGS